MSTLTAVKSLVISAEVTVHKKGAPDPKWHRNCVERWRQHTFTHSEGFKQSSQEFRINESEFF